MSRNQEDEARRMEVLGRMNAVQADSNKILQELVDDV